MPNKKVYKIKGKEYNGIELTEGEQLILMKENNKRLKEFNDKKNTTLQTLSKVDRS